MVNTDTMRTTNRQEEMNKPSIRADLDGSNVIYDEEFEDEEKKAQTQNSTNTQTMQSEQAQTHTSMFSAQKR